MSLSEMFYWIGLVLCIGSGVFVAIMILNLIVGQIFNILGMMFPIIWKTIEFVYYRKEFKEWKALKDSGKAPTEEEVQDLRRIKLEYEKVQEIVYSAYNDDDEAKKGEDLCTIGEKVCKHFRML